MRGGGDERNPTAADPHRRRRGAGARAAARPARRLRDELPPRRRRGGERARGARPAAPRCRPTWCCSTSACREMDGIELARHLAKARARRRPSSSRPPTTSTRSGVRGERDRLPAEADPRRALAAALAQARAGGPPRREALARGGCSRAGRAALPLGAPSAGGSTWCRSTRSCYLKAELKYITVRTAEREYLLEESLDEARGGVRRALRARPPQLPRRARRACAASSGRSTATAKARLGGAARRRRGKLPVSRRQWPAVKALANA